MGRRALLQGTLLVVSLLLTRRCQATDPYPDSQFDCEGESTCRSAYAGGAECRDKSRCTGERCTDEDAAYRIGMLCNGWPGYNGGYPMSGLKWDSENEFYACLETATVGVETYCQRWSIQERSADEFEDGECVCKNDLCRNWSCVQTEQKHCNDGDWAAGNNRCCGRRCSKSRCYETCYQVQVDMEYADCGCTELAEKSDGSGQFCTKWECDEYEHDSVASEHEKYTCRENTGQYCSRWTGDIDSTEEFETTDCECRVVGTNGHFCQEWFCFEKGLDYWYPNLLWSFLPICAGLFGIWLAVSDKVFRKGKTCGIFILFGWISGWIILGVWLAGILVLIISAAVLLALPLLVCFCKKYKKNSYTHTPVEKYKPPPTPEVEPSPDPPAQEVNPPPQPIYPPPVQPVYPQPVQPAQPVTVIIQNDPPPQPTTPHHPHPNYPGEQYNLPAYETPPPGYGPSGDAPPNYSGANYGGNNYGGGNY